VRDDNGIRSRADARGRASGYRYAGAWIRLLALILDGLLVFAVIYVLFIFVGGALLLAYPQVAETAVAKLDSNTWPAGLVSYVVATIVSLVWFGGWQAGVGATPAMLALKLRVRDRTRQHNPTFRAAVLRNSPQMLASFGDLTGTDSIDVMLGVVGFIVYAAIGLSITSSPECQGLHDRLAGTYVVRRR
jgi:uncharacterized RDD family membrane protein YckC